MAKEEPLVTEPGGLFPRLQERFGLSRDPLAMDQPFFGGAQRQHGLETLRHLAGFGDMALVITGERGCGKTRMLAELVRSESEKLSFHRLQPQELTSEQALANRLMAIAHKTLGNGQSARDAVFGFFKWSEAATGKGRRLVLLLDDADHVPAEVLRILLGAHRNADTAHAAVPVLSGAEQILDLLAGIDTGDPAQALLHRIDLRPLSPDELADYLSPRLVQAGGDASELLSRSRLQQLHTLSQGSPGRLKRIAPAVWLDLAGASPQSKRAGKPISKHQILWPVLAVALLAISWVLVSWQYDETAGNGTESAAEKAADQPPVVERKMIRFGPAEDGNDIATTESASPAPDSASSGSLPGDSKPTGQPVVKHSAVASAPPASMGKPRQVDEAEPASHVNSTLSGSDQTESERGRQIQGDAEPDEKQAKAATEQKPRQSNASGKGFQPARPERFVAISIVRKRSGFTAQYVAGYEEKTAISVLDQFPDVKGLVYTRSLRKGKPWYVVFYGQFASRAQANQVLQSRSGNLDGLTSRDRWVRGYAGF